MRDFFWHQYLRFWTREPICGRMIFGDDIKMTLSRKKKCFFICSLNSLRILDWLKHLQASESEHWYNIFLKGWNKRFCRVSDPLTFWQTDISPQTSTYTTSQPTASAPGWVFILGLLLFYFFIFIFSLSILSGKKKGDGYCLFILFLSFASLCFSKDARIKKERKRKSLNIRRAIDKSDVLK